MTTDQLTIRAARHAALGEPVRLAIVDELARADRSPIELRHLLGIESNLLAHHLDVLESAGLLTRSRSTGDGRRRYLHLQRAALGGMLPGPRIKPTRALFICTHNAARSQLAAALWRSITLAPAESAGTKPAAAVHPMAIAAAERAGLDLSGATPRALVRVREMPQLVVTVCDRAHEELEGHDHWLHWSLPDPAAGGSRRAFDAVVAELRARITALVAPTSRVVAG